MHIGPILAGWYLPPDTGNGNSLVGCVWRGLARPLAYLPAGVGYDDAMPGRTGTPWARGGSGGSSAVEEVILVDENDTPIGTLEKLRAHQDGGRLHRALSVFIFDRQDRVLLQRRAAGKYHFAGLWSNACCSHPRPGESNQNAALRRLREELGVVADLHRACRFAYAAYDPQSGLHEREFLHVWVGTSEGPCAPDPEEVAETRWTHRDAIRMELENDPSRFTPWFAMAWERLNA